MLNEFNYIVFAELYKIHSIKFYVGLNDQKSTKKNINVKETL